MSKMLRWSRVIGRTGDSNPAEALVQISETYMRVEL